MDRVSKAGFVYFLMVFAIGFMFGTVRVLFVEPRLGAVLSVALEVPLMLVIAWFAARFAVTRFAVATTKDAISAGLIGVVLLVVAETLLGIGLGQGLAAQIGAYGTTRGLLTSMGQVGFAAMPALAVARRQQT
ncbi:MAG: hypothetical protein KF723_04225 [Rhizobiaceae bacterium]|nr:hypothetical protein [Rhizobiaceae bacterium]